jgi:hypothetical protein
MQVTAADGGRGSCEPDLGWNVSRPIPHVLLLDANIRLVASPSARGCWLIGGSWPRVGEVYLPVKIEL